jgi:signal transduction histidine kinase
VTFENIDLEHFLSEISEEVSSFLKEGQTLNINRPSDITAIKTDPRILRNIMFNLISNASKYSDINSAIALTCVKDDSTIVFRITDQGIGIPKEDQKHLFDRFYRASNAGNIQGTGLGLNIVRRYVELIGGEISFESEYEKGSTFLIRIPHQQRG